MEAGTGVLGISWLIFDRADSGVVLPEAVCCAFSAPEGVVFGGIDVDDGSNEMERSSVGDDRGVVRVDPTRTTVRQGVVPRRDIDFGVLLIVEGGVLGWSPVETSVDVNFPGSLLLGTDSGVSRGIIGF